MANEDCRTCKWFAVRRCGIEPIPKDRCRKCPDRFPCCCSVCGEEVKFFYEQQDTKEAVKGRD